MNVTFSEIDTQGSGYITFSEFRSAVKNHDANASNNAIFSLFKKYCNAANEKNKVKFEYRQLSI